MIRVKGINGNDRTISRFELERLRMLMDWQLRRLGYDPTSVTEACGKRDGR